MCNLCSGSLWLRCYIWYSFLLAVPNVPVHTVYQSPHCSIMVPYYGHRCDSYRVNLITKTADMFTRRLHRHNSAVWENWKWTISNETQTAYITVKAKRIVFIDLRIQGSICRQRHNSIQCWHITIGECRAKRPDEVRRPWPLFSYLDVHHFRYGNRKYIRPSDN